VLTKQKVWRLTSSTCRIRNKAKLRAIDLVDPRNKDLRTDLQKAEVAQNMAGDTVEDDEESQPNGPGSESD
jgi:uncharacterized protein